MNFLLEGYQPLKLYVPAIRQTKQLVWGFPASAIVTSGGRGLAYSVRVVEQWIFGSGRKRHAEVADYMSGASSLHAPPTSSD